MIKSTFYEVKMYQKYEYIIEQPYNLKLVFLYDKKLGGNPILHNNIKSIIELLPDFHSNNMELKRILKELSSKQFYSEMATLLKERQRCENVGIDFMDKFDNDIDPYCWEILFDCKMGKFYNFFQRATGDYIFILTERDIWYMPRKKLRELKYDE